METVDEIFQTIDAALKKDPSRSQGMNAVYQFNLSGEEEGTYHVVMRPEDSYAGVGKAEDPNCTLSMSSADFKKLVQGKMNGTTAFLTGKLRLKGDMGLALRLQDVLSAYNAS
ncbi:SCP2 sterol-binding domain-containing protein [Heyndrickxia coagulans]|uniref:SCP2 sterol-binding domain-containing protein n=1 Tax=Heyndrickxia coagulans TaxID=1398 RepID=UPI0023E3801B|nr:SCP2 sterol-binding domain-containing protein [Heyndrickxia coagulans]